LKRLDDNMGIIYGVRCFVTQKWYIGQTAYPLKQYWGYCLNQARRGDTNKRHLYAAIRKYGWEAFELKLLANVSAEWLDEAEIFFIWLFQSNTPRLGYNLTPGGKGVRGIKLSLAHRQKIAQSCKGLKRSRATRDKMGRAKVEQWKDDKYRQKVLRGIRQPHKVHRTVV
jgi:group I intron endonuclease